MRRAPGKSGLAVCQEIRKAGLITPILMLTALAQTSDKVAGLKIGAHWNPQLSRLMARISWWIVGVPRIFPL